MVAREPGQIREEAALSDPDHAPRGSLAGVRGRRERSEADLDSGCTVRFRPSGWVPQAGGAGGAPAAPGIARNRSQASVQKV